MLLYSVVQTNKRRRLKTGENNSVSNSLETQRKKKEEYLLTLEKEANKTIGSAATGRKVEEGGKEVEKDD